MKIQIQPVQTWTPTGILSADLFEVRYVNYSNGTATADCHLWSGETEVAAQLVTATSEQTADWTDDKAFFEVLAQNAGLTPVEAA